jgi:hypothetical protein
VGVLQIDDVVAAAAGVGGVDRRAVQLRRVGDVVRRARHGIGERPVERPVRGECQRVVVRAGHRLDRMAEVAGHPFVRVGEGGEVRSVGLPFADRDRRVAVRAERAEGVVRLALGPPVHRLEHRIVGGVGVHAPRPLLELRRMAGLAGQRVHQVGLRQRGRRPRPAPRQGAERDEGNSQALHTHRSMFFRPPGVINRHPGAFGPSRRGPRQTGRRWAHRRRTSRTASAAARRRAERARCSGASCIARRRR